MIEPAQASDAPAIAEILSQSVQAMDCTMAAAASATEIEAQLEALHDNETWLVVRREGAVLGWGVVKRYSPRPGYRWACETSVFLDRRHLGQGLGRPLQQALLERAQQFGYHHVVARVWADNAASIAFHQRFGYQVVGIQKEIGFVGERWRDVAILQKILPV